MTTTCQKDWKYEPLVTQYFTYQYDYEQDIYHEWAILMMKS